MKFVNHHLLTILLFLMLSETKAQWVEISVSGDSLMFANEVFRSASADSSAYILRFFRFSNGEAQAFESRIEKVHTNDFKTVMLDIRDHYHLVKEIDPVSNEQLNLVKKEYKIFKFKYLGRGARACSKGCVEHLYYFIHLDLRLFVKELDLFDQNDLDLIYDKACTAEWGKRAKRDKWPDLEAAFKMHIYPLPDKKNYFVHLSWFPGKSESRLKTAPIEKYFFIN